VRASAGTSKMLAKTTEAELAEAVVASPHPPDAPFLTRG